MSARRNTEEELRQSTEVFQLLVSSVREYAIFMLDPDGNVATWNSGAERIKGYAPEEIIGRHFSTFYGEEDVRRGKPQRELEIAREQGSIEDEGWRVRKDGSRFWANVVITAVRGSHGELHGFAKVTRDLTERKQGEEMRRALLVARDANRAKDEFLMTLSHELRTPMTSILGWARLLPGMPAGDPLIADAIASITRNAELQARLIDDILEVSRIVSGKLRLRPETVEVGRLIRNAVEAVVPTAAAKQITLTTSIAPELGAIVADPTRIQQVVWNLLANAMKFTPKRGAVEVSARRVESRVQITVTDNGEGIDPRFLPQIFEPFRQAESVQTRVHGGLGLGLSIVRYIVEAHGGTVAAESEGAGKGATFTVTLPVRAVAVVPEPVRSAVEVSFDSNRLLGLEIVLVDDEHESRKLLETVLRAAGADVLPVESATAALAAIDRRRPDLVITDIAMPELDGHSFARTLRSREYGPSLKLVALSAFPATTESASAFDVYLAKPIDPFRLVDEVAKVGGKG